MACDSVSAPSTDRAQGRLYGMVENVGLQPEHVAAGDAALRSGQGPLGRCDVHRRRRDDRGPAQLWPEGAPVE